MGASNLAIVFAPSLLRPIKETIDSAMKDSKYTVRLMELFIAQTDQFFDVFFFSFVSFLLLFSNIINCH